MGKLRLNQDIIFSARNKAMEIADDVQRFITHHTTVTVERTVLRLLGVDGVNEFDVPYPNIVINHIKDDCDLTRGASVYIASAIKKLHLSPQEIAEKIATKTLDLQTISLVSRKETNEILKPIIEHTLNHIAQNKETRAAFQSKYQTPQGALKYVIVATGNIYEDVTQAKAAARAGADVIAVIRTTGQSLLDFVPYGPTTEGFGGTYATQENFRIMREALDEVGEEVGRYIMLVNYASGLCMPEIAAMGAVERLDMMLNDSLYGILFRDINMKRTFIDQYFSRVINAFAGIIINTGEDNYLTTSDAVTEAHTVLASQFLNEQFAKRAHMKEELMGLGHAFEIDPEVENGFLYEIAQAQMARQIFPNSPLKYMPPTKHMTGNIFKGYVQNTLFNIVTHTTNQGIHLLGMLTEAVHTPFMSDRYLAIENAKYIEQTMKDFSSEIEFKKGGIIEERANNVLRRAELLLEEITNIGMFETIEQGKFAGIKRPIDGGKGLSGVYLKHPDYTNPVLDLMVDALKEAN